MDLVDFLERGDAEYLPHLSVDIVIIGYRKGRLKCLLLRIGNKWLLPGGYIGRKESVDDAAIRILGERTGLGNPHLKFLDVFGNKDRQFSDEWKAYFTESNIPWKESYWITERFVTLTYYSLVDIEQVNLRKGLMDDEIAWFDYNELPEIWLDHRSIILSARERLKGDLRQEQITYNLLPEKFTMPQLHELHQVILQEKLDRSRFQKKMLATGMLERLPELPKERPGRNPFQYRVKNV
ncbi:MAG: NUDIX domain-containing protein [Cyclobacteriaceae bacterium]